MTLCVQHGHQRRFVSCRPLNPQTEKLWSPDQIRARTDFCGAQLYKKSVFINPNDRRGPWAEAPSSESVPLTLDIRGASVTQLNRRFGESDILEVPAPPYIDLHARHDTTVRDSRPAAALRGARCGHLVRARQRNAKGLARDGECHQRTGRWGGRRAVSARARQTRHEDDNGHERGDTQPEHQCSRLSVTLWIPAVRTATLKARFQVYWFVDFR